MPFLLRLVRSAFAPALLLFLAACPSLQLAEVSLKPDSMTATTFTLAAKAVVTETDETEGEGKQTPSGKGVVALRLPEGWTATQVRLMVPGEPNARALPAAPQMASAFADAFPQATGRWWAFSSPTQSIHKGTWSYGIEVDVAVPKKTREGVVGLTVGPLKEDTSDLPATAELRVDFKLKSVLVLSMPAETTTNSGLGM